MTALVTGAAGFLGTALVDRLLEREDDDLRLFVRPGAQQEEIEARHPDLELVAGSLTDPAACAKAVAGVDTVYHLAAGTRGAPAERFLNSAVATSHLLDAILAEDRPVKTVVVSSIAVYGTADLGRGALVDERTPLEARPTARDVYTQAKLRQEQLVREYHERHDLATVVLRPGVIYGPGVTGIPARVGLDLPGLFLHIGGGNALPLAHVENCAEAIAVAARHPDSAGEAYNVVDDDLPTCAEYLRAYRTSVEPIRSVRLPYPAARALSVAVERYHEWSKGQLPAVLTPYKTAAMWGGNRFSNEKIKGIGYRQPVPTRDGLQRMFEALQRLSVSGNRA